MWSKNRVIHGFIWLSQSCSMIEIYCKWVNWICILQISFHFNFQNINTTTPLFTVSGLKTNTKYRFFVIARNAFGTSLPSSVITTNVSKEAWDGLKIDGVPSSPHLIEVTQTGADYLTLSWTASTISHHEDEHKYKCVFFVELISLKLF